jgi:restriction system protein
VHVRIFTSYSDERKTESRPGSYYLDIARTTPRDHDVLTRTIARLPVYAGPALAATVYAGIGLVIPLSLGGDTVGLVCANVIGVSLGWSILLAWALGLRQAAERRLLVELTTDLRNLSPKQFEWLVGEVLRREDWEIQETGRHDGPDGNIDLLAQRRGQTLVVQCKRWRSWNVGVAEVRELAGTVSAEGLPHGAGMLVTLSDFTPDAVAEAQRTAVSLVNGRDLLARIEGVRRPEHCADCGTAMVLDHSLHEWWLRCPRYGEGCKGKRDLAADPGAVMSLLLES